jgi:hypothetical protein
MAEEISFTDIKELFLETNQRFKETDLKFKEMERLLDAKFRETDKKLNKATDLFTSQWGRLVESLVEGDLVKILR